MTMGWFAGAAGVVLLIVLALWFRARRSVIRRVGAVVARLDERPQGVEGGGGNLESALSRLERTTDRVNTRLADLGLERERVLAALDAIDEGIVVTNEVGRVVLRNETATEFATARDSDLLAEDVVRSCLDLALQGSEVSREVQLFGPPRRSLLIRAVPLAEAGGALGAAAFIRDVSTVRRVDSVRRDFVANVSHELRTPIGALVALAETLEDERDAAVMERLARRVRNEAERLGRIVDDLLDLSHIEAQEAPEREAVPARRIIDAALDRVESAAAQAGATITVADVRGDLLASCDVRQLTSAVANLLDNALKYLGDLGDAVEAGAEADRGEAVFWVRDNGIGIPESDRDRIFERFYRVDRARSRASGGTGLGLAIVRHVAQAHGGSVRVESEEGVGSTFSIRVPMAHAGDSLARLEP